MHNNRKDKEGRILADFREIHPSLCFELGKVNYTKAYRPLPDHIHAHSFELVYIVKGMQQYQTAGKIYPVENHQVFLSFPDEIHSSGNAPEHKSLFYYLIMDAQMLSGSLLTARKQEAENMRYALQKLRETNQRVFKTDPSFGSKLDFLLHLYDSSAPFALTRIRNCLSELLVSVLLCAEHPSPDRSHALQPALDYIRQHIQDNISAEALAALVHLSVPRFRMNFRKETGLPPQDYILREKINTAKNLLVSSAMSITDIAFTLSFSSSQYFATVFKRYTLFTPSQYRAAAKEID